MQNILCYLLSTSVGLGVLGTLVVFKKTKKYVTKDVHTLPIQLPSGYILEHRSEI
jgi:hypothetical protein